jgi:hypothetical protein
MAKSQANLYHSLFLVTVASENIQMRGVQRRWEGYCYRINLSRSTPSLYKITEKVNALLAHRAISALSQRPLS